MNRTWIITMAGALLWAAVAMAADPASRPGEFFEMHRLHSVHLRISAKRWEMMQPTRASRLAFVMQVSHQDLPATQPAANQELEEDDDHAGEGKRIEPGAAGNEFAWVRAAVEIDGQAFPEVGLRFKGNGSYNSSTWLRRPFKLDFDRFMPGRLFMGVETLNLHMSAVDPSYLREALSYQVYRKANVPAPRTTFALMYLSIEGQCEGQYIGLYTLVEDVDKHFLKRHFDTAKGLLLKPEGFRNLPYLGEDWDEYWRYQPKVDGNRELRRRLIDFVRMLHYGDEETFVSSIESYLDVDEFLRFLAALTLLADMDSFLGGSHNYYLYLHPEDGRFRILPWDMHLSFGGTGRGAEERVVHLSVVQPYTDPHRLIERVLGVEVYRRRFEGYLKSFTTSCFDPATLGAEIDGLQAVIRRAEEVERGPVKGRGATTMPARPLREMPELKGFISKRVESVLGQLAGQVEGYAPGQRLPVPPPPPTVPRLRLPPPPPPAKLAASARKLAKIADVSRRSVKVGPAKVSNPPVKHTQAPPAPPPPPPKAIPVALPRVPRVVPRKMPNPLVSVMLRMLEEERDNALAGGELTDMVRLGFYIVGGKKAEAMDEAALARGLERIGNLLDTTWIAPLPGKAPPAAEPGSPAAVWAKAIFKEADGNGDGRLGLLEAVEGVQRWLGRVDANHDGLLNAQELGEGLEQMVPR